MVAPAAASVDAALAAGHLIAIPYVCFFLDWVLVISSCCVVSDMSHPLLFPICFRFSILWCFAAHGRGRSSLGEKPLVVERKKENPQPFLVKKSLRSASVWRSISLFNLYA